MTRLILVSLIGVAVTLYVVKRPTPIEEETRIIVDFNSLHHAWPLQVQSSQTTVATVNGVGLYLSTVKGLMTGVSEPRFALREAIRIELVRQELLKDYSLSPDEQALLPTPSVDEETYSSRIQTSLRQIIISRVDQDTIEILASAPEPAKQEQRQPTRDLSILLSPHSVRGRGDQALIENQLKELRAQIIKGELSFSRACELYGDPQRPQHISMLQPSSAGETRLPEEVVDLIFSMPIGELSLPVRVEGRLALLMVMSEALPNTLPAQPDQSRLIQEVNRRAQERWRALLQKAQSQAEIEVPIDALERRPSHDQVFTHVFLQSI